ncbi:MAG: hypothetical protein M3Z33_03915 [Actinomycetota bacterium]|nr:hypothetical protein [Actinomycetota bacterium]
MYGKATKFLRHHAVALVALFVALGGTSYAVTRVPLLSVGNGQIRNGAVTTVKMTVGAKNYLRAGTGPPARAVRTRATLSGPQAIAPNVAPGTALTLAGTSWTATSNEVDAALGQATVTTPAGCKALTIDVLDGSTIVAMGTTTSDNGGQPQTIGLRPEGSILGTGAKTLTARAVNGCVGATVTVSAVNLAAVGFN